MVELNDCPNDVIHELMNHIHVADFDNFRLTCKRIHLLPSWRVKEHSALKKRYSKVSINGSDIHPAEEPFEGGLTEFEHPTILLSEIFQKPLIANYVNYVVYTGLNDEDTVETDYHTVHPEWEAQLRSRYGSDYLKALVPFAVQTPNDVHQRADWASELRKGGQAATFAVLLSLLPNMHTLRLMGSHFWHLDDVPFDISTGDHKHYLGPIVDHATAAHKTGSGKDLPFGKLENVYWDDEDPERFLNVCPHIGYFVRFMELPAIKRMRGPASNDWFGFDEEKPQSSNLESVDLCGAALHSHEVQAFIKPIRNLQEFRYTFSLRTVSDATFWESQDGLSMVEALHSQAQTLEILSILPHPVNTTTGPATFRCFEKLRTLEVDIGLLINMPEEETEIWRAEPDPISHTTSSEATPRIEDNLPGSLEALTIHLGDWADLNSEIDQLFRGFPAGSERLPKLRRITMHCRNDVSRLVREQIEAADIKLEVVKLYL